MYKCIECKKNICPLCKLEHDKKHKIINYELQDYICNNHIDVFTKYCNDCKKNICRKCEREHKSHNSISLGEMIPDNENEELKKYIDKLKTEINDIIIKLKNIKENIEIYYKISNNIINNIDKINYNNLKNINEMIDNNNKIIKDIKEIIEKDKIEDKFNNLMNIYDNMNTNNYITAEINIKKEDINEDIQIINSFENVIKNPINEIIENLGIKEEDYYKYEYEKEIKENCKIKINNK